MTLIAAIGLALFLVAGPADANVPARFETYRTAETDSWRAFNVGDRADITTASARRRTAEDQLFQALDDWARQGGDIASPRPHVESLLLARRRGREDLVRRAITPLLSRLPAADPDHGLLRFLSGDLAEAAGRKSDAAAEFRRAADDPAFPARGLAGYRLGLLLAATGDTAGARKALETALAHEPPGARTDETRLWLAEADLRAGRTDAALTAAVGLTGASLTGDAKARSLLLLARAYRAAGQASSARAAYLELFRGATSSAQAREGWNEFTAIAGSTITDSETRLGAAVFLKGGNHEKGLRLLRGVTTGAEGVAAIEDEALHFYSQKKWDLSGQTYTAMLRRATDPRDRGRARLGLGRNLRNAGRIPEMERTYGQLRADSTSGEYAARGGWELAREYKALGRFADCEAALSVYIEKFPYGEDILNALELRGVVRMIRKQPEAAQGDFEELRRRANRTSEREEAGYWIARASLARGDSANARAALRAALVHDLPDGLYGYRVRHLLATLSPQDTASYWFPTPVFDPKRNELEPAGLPDIPFRPQSHFRRGVALARAGFTKDAIDELNQAIRFSEDDPTILDVTASLAARLDMYLYAMTTARRALAKESAAPVRARLWRYVYAPGFYDLVGPASERHGLDPMLVAALIRQESLFDPRAVSRAGARGLMQLMHPTAQRVARSLGDPAPSLDDLFRPDVSVRYGTTYLRDKLEEFDNRIEVALSAYNAGEGKAREWAGLLDEYDPDLYRELIDYSETRDYVRRVEYNRQTFHLFYNPRAAVR